MRLVDLAKPAKLAVSLDDAKTQCRLLDNEHDTLIERLISAVTYQVETRCEMRLITRSMRLDLDGFPSGGADIEIPVYPVSSITSVSYTDTDGNSQSLTQDTGGSPVGDYWAITEGMCPLLRPLNLWPSYKLYKPASVQITFSAGYSDTSEIPEDLKHGILLRVKELFDHAGESVAGMSMASTVSSFDSLVMPYRRWRV